MFKRPYLLLAFCFSMKALAASQGETSACVDRMLRSPSIRSPYLDIYLPFLKEITEISPELMAETNWKWSSRSDLETLEQRFRERLEGKSPLLRLRLDLHEYQHRKHGKGLLLLGVIYLDTEESPSVGQFARSFRRSPIDGKIEVWGDGLRLDHRYIETRKLIFPLLDYVDSIYTDVGVDRERLVADWRGRYYWTMSNFDFDPDYRFFEQNRESTELRDQLTVIRNAFARFLRLNEIPLDELLIVENGTTKPVRSLQDFNRPQDFIRAVHPSRKISVRALVEVETIEPATKPLEVGVAFALADYAPVYGAGDTNILSCSSMLAYSNSTMPAWRAIRRFR